MKTHACQNAIHRASIAIAFYLKFAAAEQILKDRTTTTTSVYQFVATNVSTATAHHQILVPAIWITSSLTTITLASRTVRKTAKPVMPRAILQTSASVSRVIKKFQKKTEHQQIKFANLFVKYPVSMASALVSTNVPVTTVLK